MAAFDRARARRIGSRAAVLAGLAAAAGLGALALLPDTGTLVSVALGTPPSDLRACRCRPDSLLAYARADGLPVVARLYRPDGAPRRGVLLIHGNTPEGSAHPYFRVVARGLAEAGSLVLAPDLAGYGGSGDPLSLETPAALEMGLDARAAFELLRRLLGPDLPVHVVGHSRGGVPALELALGHEEVASAVAIGPSRRILERMADPVDLRQFWEREVARRRDLHGLEMPAWYGEPQFRTLMEANALEVVAPGLREAGHPPTLFVEGEEEPAEDRAYLADMVRGFAPPVEHVVVEGDHYSGVGYDRPWSAGPFLVYDGRAVEGLIALLRDWLDRHG